MARVRPTTKIVLAGDGRVDANIAITSRRGGNAGWRRDQFASTSYRASGVFGLSSILSEVLKNDWVEVIAPRVPDRLDDTTKFPLSTAIWQQFPVGDREVWRVQEHLGLRPGSEIPSLEAEPAIPDLIVIDDGNLGFSNSKDAWPKTLSGSDAPILANATSLSTESPLLSQLFQQPARLTVVVSTHALRDAGAMIARGSTWERAAKNIMWELEFNSRFSWLSRCSCVVVHCGPEGAVVKQLRDGTSHYFLVYDPQLVEGDYYSIHPGEMIAATGGLLASLTREIALQLAPDIPSAVARGLMATRCLHASGFRETRTSAGSIQLSYPTELVAAQLNQKSTSFYNVKLPQQGSGSSWTVLGLLQESMPQSVADDVVTSGPAKTIEQVPKLKMGKLISVDEKEVEGFRSVRTLMFEYLKRLDKSRPLSIAVFGPPGSGKSFGVKEIAQGMFAGQLSYLDFNLSQYSQTGDLYRALHQVRDVALTGKVPLVFFDEFDAVLNGRPLGWLAHLLAPMQDGRFTEDLVSHWIGPAIFVFAGGTKHTFEDFVNREDDDEVRFRESKGPDFVSRLSGYVNVRGTNDDAEDAPSLATQIRRALLLRSAILQFAPHLTGGRLDGDIPVEDGVLNAFMRVSRYRHGARSIQTIVGMSSTTRGNRYDRSSLPPENQLDLHTNAKEFLALSRIVRIEDPILDELAESLHIAAVSSAVQAEKARKEYHRNETIRTRRRVFVASLPAWLARNGFVLLSNEEARALPQHDISRLWPTSQDLDREWWQEKTRVEFGVASTTFDKDLVPANIRAEHSAIVRSVESLMARLGLRIIEMRLLKRQ